MKILRFIFIILAGIALTITMMFYELPFWLIYMSVVVLYLLILVVPSMYIVYKSNNLKRIERYLEANKRKPLFAYPLAVKTGDRAAMIQVIQDILKKYKQPYVQEVYKTNLALYENDVSKFDELAKQISKEPLHTYYIAYAEALKGNFVEARAFKENLRAPWMQHAIEAVIAKEQSDMKTFREESTASIAAARGIQKFNLLYSFQYLEKN